MPKLRTLVQEPVSNARFTVEQFLCDSAAGPDGPQAVLSEQVLTSLAWYPPAQHMTARLEETSGFLCKILNFAQALTEALSNVRAHVAPPMWNGAELLKHLQDNARLLPTGCVRVDELLAGGLREGHLTELYGEPASGKTQLCVMAAVAAAMRGERVTYVDTTGSFSGRRAASVYNTLRSRMQDSKSLMEVLQQIQVNHVHTVHETLAVADNIACSMPALVDTDSPCQPKLIILDSVSSVITPILGAGGSQQSQGHALMSALGRMLKYIAVQHTAAVLCTNHMVGSGTNPRPALGESWKVQPHTRLQLLRPDVGDDRHAVLSASTTAACSQQVTFQLT